MRKLLEAIRGARRFPTLKIFRSEVEKLKRCDVLLICHDNDKGLTVNGKAYSPLLDTVHDELASHGLICQALALPWSTLGYNETFARAILFSRNYLFCKIYNIIASRCGLHTINVYEEIIKKTQPKVILGIGLPADLCASAKRHKVLDIELLHGMGYALIPKQWQTNAPETVPSSLMALDQKSERTMKPLELLGAKVLRVPHPFLRRFLDPSVTFPAEWEYGFDRSIYQKVVLVSLQWGYAGDHGEYHCFEGLLPNGLFYDDLEVLITRRRDIFWKFRLHPVQLRGVHRERMATFMRIFSSKHPNVSWELPSSLPLPVIARSADGHLTMCSMSCYEVAALGLQSLVLCPTTRDNGPYSDYFDDLIEEGYVVKHSFDIDFVEQWVDGLTLMEARALDNESEANWCNFIDSIANVSRK